jgi:hypothetical protein
MLKALDTLAGAVGNVDDPFAGCMILTDLVSIGLWSEQILSPDRLGLVVTFLLAALSGLQ